MINCFQMKKEIEILKNLLQHALKMDSKAINYDWVYNFNRPSTLNAELVIIGRHTVFDNIIFKQQLRYGAIEYNKYLLSAPERITNEYMEAQLYFSMVSNLLQHGIFASINVQSQMNSCKNINEKDSLNQA